MKNKYQTLWYINGQEYLTLFLKEYTDAADF